MSLLIHNDPVNRERINNNSFTGPISCQPDQTLFDNCTIVRKLGQGAFGRVFQVHDKISGYEYAVKMLRPDLSRDPSKEKLFFQELRTWIDLPSHVNLTACRFVRMLNEQILICCEYIDGGSLESVIRAGGYTTVESIIDAAIQLARGLQVAHDWGVVHQDVKPANALVTREGIVKVTDFGLSRSLPSGKSWELSSKNEDTWTVSVGGMTLTFCSPEQAAGIKLTHKTDIWSWGVTVLHMFLGEPSGKCGFMAPTIISDIKSGAQKTTVAIPEQVIVILERCFQKNPSDRWERISDASDTLEEFYQTFTGRQYPREYTRPSPKRLKQEEKVSRQVISGARWSDPRTELRSILKRAGEPIDPEIDIQFSEPESQFARVLDDMEINRRWRETCERLYKKGHKWAAIEHMKSLHQKALILETLSDFEGAAAEYQFADRLIPTIMSHDTSFKTLNRIARMLIDAGNLSSRMHHGLHAIECYRKASSYLGDSEHAHPNSEPAAQKLYSQILGNLASELFLNGDESQSLILLDQAISIHERLIAQDKLTPAQANLGFFYGEKACVLMKIGTPKEARTCFLKSIEFITQEVDITSSVGAIKISKIYNNLGLCLKKLGLFQDVSDTFHQAFKILDAIDPAPPEIREYRVKLLFNYLACLEHTLDQDRLLELSTHAMKILEGLVYEEGFIHLRLELCTLHIWRICDWLQLTQPDESSRELLLKAIKHFQLIGRENLQSHHRAAWSDAEEYLALHWPDAPTNLHS